MKWFKRWRCWWVLTDIYLWLVGACVVMLVVRFCSDLPGLPWL
jgi:hypothetical protein